MELFRVTVEYRNLEACREWEVRLQDASRLSHKFTEPQPPPREVVRHAAVFGAFGAHMAATAARLAVEAVVGPEDSWEKFQALATKVEHVGSVAVEETKPERAV